MSDGTIGVAITSICGLLGTAILVLGNRSRKSAASSAQEAADWATALQAKSAAVEGLKEQVELLKEEGQRKDEKIASLETKIGNCIDDAARQSAIQHAHEEKIAELERLRETEREEWRQTLTELRSEVQQLRAQTTE